MSWEVRDRYLWLGFGAFLFVAVRAISNALQTTVKLCEVYDPEHAKAASDTQAEDSISLEALSTLVTSPNQDIANSATSLLLTRFAQDDQASTSLTLDLFSPSPSTRQKASQTLDLFDTHTHDLFPLRDTAVSSLYDKASPTIQLECRAYLHASRRYRQGKLHSLRAIAEAIENATRLGERSSGRLDTLAPNDDAVDVEHEPRVMFRGVEHNIESLIDILAVQAVTTRPMVRSVTRSDGEDAVSVASELPDLEDVAVDGDAAVSNVRARLHAESNQEAEARRRRREAMVLHEGGGAIGRGDIIHPRTNNMS